MTLLLFVSVCAALAVMGESRQLQFGGYSQSLAFATVSTRPSQFLLQSLRGGASKIEEEEDESESEEEESDEEEEEEDTLLASTVKATSKAQLKRTATAKKAINSGLAETASATTTKSVTKKKSGFKLPYILRAFLNPLTVFAMTKAYWASLFDLNYGKKDEPSQDLRSALEEKAKKATSSGMPRKRKMKPGQAKTLSDLPQLNT